MPIESISDDELLSTVRRLTARSNSVLAELLAHLGEVERRGIHRARACASLYTYCIYELRMSEDAAFRRSKAARLVREHPEVHDLITRGELHLTGLLMIGPYLGGERHGEILQRARFRSKSEIARLIAAIDPKPEVPPLVEPIGPAPQGPVTHRRFVESLSGPVRTLSPGRRAEDWIEPGDSGANSDEMTTFDQRGAMHSESADELEQPLRYKVQFTASQEYVDLMNEAFDLLGHETRRPDLPDVQLRAMRELVKQLKRRKRAATERPQSPEVASEADTANTALAREQTADTADTAPARGQTADTADAALARKATAETEDAALARKATAETEDAALARHVPAGIRRAVWARDGERCAYVDSRGHRCRESRGLELHHRHAHALGGPATFDNLEVRCRAHNALAAEADFGREHMDLVRGARHADCATSIEPAG